MDKSILKLQWERHKAPIDLSIATASRLIAPYSKNAIDRVFLLSQGCININYKVTFKNKNPPVVLRIYAKEKLICHVEASIQKLVADSIPVARFLYVDTECTLYPYPYAIMEWVDGTLMRDIILSTDEKAIAECAFDAGLYLAALKKIIFPQAGFFQENLQIRPLSQEDHYLPLVLSLLQGFVVKKSLGEILHLATQKLVVDQAHLLLEMNEANLTHSDYDPSNMLVKRINNKWKIVAVLDWEFAYAGTYLLDLGLMLRYSHKLPDCYEREFIGGIETSGAVLPLEWKKQAKLMDLLCLLQLIYNDPLMKRPKMNQDVVSLISYNVQNWNLFRVSL